MGYYAAIKSISKGLKRTCDFLYLEKQTNKKEQQRNRIFCVVPSLSKLIWKKLTKQQR